MSILGIISTSGKSSIAGKATIAKNPWQMSKIWKICKRNRKKKGIKKFKVCFKYRGSPDSTVFAPPGNRTIEKTVLFGD